MRSRLWLNLILLVIVAGLAALVVFEPGKKEQEKPKLMAQFDEEAVNRIEIERKDTVIVEKRGDRWWLASPYSASANPFRIQQILRIPQAESLSQYPLSKGDLARYELDKPKAILHLDGARLAFGGTDPIDMRRYVQVGDRLHLVADNFYHHLVADATDYIDKKLLPEDDSLKRLELPGLTVSQDDKGAWTAEPPPPPGAPLYKLVSDWQNARAIAIEPFDQTEAEGKTIKVSFAQREPVTFLIVQREPEFILARKDLGLQYQLPAETGKQLLSVPEPPAEKAGSKPADQSP